jgi:tetratricopeptide (TPR) repeat protein
MKVPASPPMTRTRLLSAALVPVLAAVVFAGAVLALRSGRDATPRAEAVASPLTTDGRIALAQEAIRQRPDDDLALAALAGAALDKVRESGDPSWYSRADEASRRALALAPGNPAALDAAASLAASRHDFRRALTLARRSEAAAPDRLAPIGIGADALVELGRYREGFAAIGHRLDLRPDLVSYSRASYAEELMGDRATATSLMALAVDAGRPGSEGRAWAQVQLGLLRLGSGDLAGARREMRTALAHRPGDARALAGLARVDAAAGALEAAAAGFQAALDRLPLPEYPAALAEIHLAQGRPAAARQDLALVRAMQRLLAANGVRVDLDLSLISADFSRPDAAAVARARAARAARPGVVGDDVLGWVLTRAGRCDEGHRVAQRSLRLGTRDALMLFHAGMAARCAGDRAEAAARLREALLLNPRFSVRWAPVARRALAEVAR